MVFYGRKIRVTGYVCGYWYMIHEHAYDEVRYYNTKWNKSYEIEWINRRVEKNIQTLNVIHKHLTRMYRDDAMPLTNSKDLLP